MVERCLAIIGAVFVGRFVVDVIFGAISVWRKSRAQYHRERKWRGDE